MEIGPAAPTNIDAATFLHAKSTHAARPAVHQKQQVTSKPFLSAWAVILTRPPFTALQHVKHGKYVRIPRNIAVPFQEPATLERAQCIQEISFRMLYNYYETGKVYTVGPLLIA